MRLVCLLGLLVVGFAPAAKSEAAEPPFRVVGYLPDYRLMRLDAAVGKDLTDIVYFSAKPEPTGGLDLGPLKPSGIATLREIKKQHGTSLILSVGGWERSNGFAAMSASKEARARFVDALLKFCAENDFDGVDLDWEHPTGPKQVRDWGLLLNEIKAKFAPKGLRLTIAVAGWQDLPREAIEAVDRFHLMAYDHEGRHSTFKSAKEDVERLQKRGVPPAKIYLGLPFYGRSIKDRRRETTYAEIAGRAKLRPDLDEVDGVYFNGVATIEQKTRYAKEAGLGGVMIWEIGQDIRDERSLLKAIGRAMRPRPAQG
jgi:chitinase